MIVYNDKYGRQCMAISIMISNDPIEMLSVHYTDNYQGKLNDVVSK